MALVTVMISLLIVIYLTNKKINIGIALTIGAVLIGIFNRIPVNKLLLIIFNALMDPITLELAGAIIMICILGHLMGEFKILDKMVYYLERVLRSAKVTILVIPAIMGTLIVTGGALLSAPIVGNLGERLGLADDKKATINLIFRHAFLQLIFSFSPSLILASKLTDISIWKFIKMFFPLSMLMLLTGYFAYLRNVKEPVREKLEIKKYFRDLLGLLIYISPISISLIFALVFDIPLYMSLVLGISLCILIKKYERDSSRINGEIAATDESPKKDESIFRTMYRGIKFPMIFAILGIMIFKGVIQQVNEINILLKQFINAGLPVELIIIVFASIVSFASASTQAAVALLFPIILPLGENESIKILYGMMIYITGFFSYFISPLHLCQVLTLQYFNVKTKKLYKNYVYVLPIVYFAMLIIYFVNMARL